MRVIAFITDFRHTSRILEPIGEQTIRPPPLKAKTSPPAPSPAEAVDNIPDVDALRTGPDIPGLNPRRNTPRPGNVRPKTRGSAPICSGPGKNPSARLGMHPSVDWIFDWRDNGAATIPIGLQIGKVFTLGAVPFSFSLEGGYNVVCASDTPRWLVGVELNWILAGHSRAH
jgi:hypothetical protein